MMRLLCAAVLLAMTGLSRASAASTEFQLPADAEVLLSLRLGSSATPVVLHFGNNGWRIDPDDQGERVTITQATLENNRWTADRKSATPITYWPVDESGVRAAQRISQPRSWRDRLIPLQISRSTKGIDLWAEGQWISRLDHPSHEPATFHAVLGEGDELTHSQPAKAMTSWRFKPLHLVHDATSLDRWTQSPAPLTFSEVSFARPGHQPPLDLQQAQWIDLQEDPGDFYEAYDGGPYMIHDPRMTVLRLPAQDLTAVHLLAAAVDDQALDDVVTLRIGRFGGTQNRVVFHDLQTRIPRQSAIANHPQAVQIDGLRYLPVRVPVSQAIAQDLGGVMQIEITKDVQLAVRHPDPNRFRLRPIGRQTGVKVAAITLEKPAVTMTVTSEEVGHAFNEPQTPTFHVHLHNVSRQTRSGKVIGQATTRDGVTVRSETAYALNASTDALVRLALPVKLRGYYDVSITLQDESGHKLLERKTSLALLPPLAQRQHRDQSPFGCWDFGGQHHTSPDVDQVGPLYVKLGFRYGMFSFKSEDRQRWGVIKGSEPKITNKSSRQPAGANATGYQRSLERHPDQLPVALLFHEGTIAGVQAQRAPDLFHDRPAYVLTEKEQARFDRMWEDALAAARYMREKFPKVHLRLGNGLLTFKESFYHRGFPKELFDSGGNEAGSFSRPPETQPPDPVAFNASLWMDRQLLDAHGYHEKPVTQCYEIGCASTNPGNLSLQTQADYVTRMALISLAWGIGEIRPGIISDVGNSYYFSHWGAAGYVRSYPELNVKPVFVAMATLTWVLDGARLVKEQPTSSPTIHSLLFQRADGDHVQVLWTLQGQRAVTLELTSGQKATLINDQGRETVLPPDAMGRVKVTISGSPVYVRSKDGSAIHSLEDPVYDKPLATQPLDALQHFEDWQVVTEADPVLDYYNSFTPRKLGDFKWTLEQDSAGGRPVWRVTPQQVESGPMHTFTMPRYMAVRHRQGLELPADARALSLWVHGNGGWGRVIYDLEDASGQRWTSIGAPMPSPPAVWDHESLAPVLRATLKDIGINDWNTDDVFGVSRINHEGWRQMTFDLPGHYPGEGYGWPRNSQWRHDGDGQVHGPLKLRQIIVELPRRTLTLKRFEPVEQPWIELRDLGTIPGK